MPIPATVAVIEDSPTMQRSLLDLFSANPNVIVLGCASSVPDARQLVASTNPSLITLDLWLEDGSSLGLISEFRDQHPQACIVVLTQHADAFIRKKATAAGANHFVDKANGFHELTEIVARRLDCCKNCSNERAAIPPARTA